MTVNHVSLKGQQVELEDGSTIALWTEEEDHRGVTVVAKSQDGSVVGRVRIEHESGHPAGSVSFWTAANAHRQDIARAALQEALRWVAAEDLPFVSGELAVDGDVTRAFLARCGLIVAWRTAGTTAKFAILVPGRPHDAVQNATAAQAFLRAAAALEGGASVAEADALYERLEASVRHHPSSHAA